MRKNRVARSFQLTCNTFIVFVLGILAGCQTSAPASRSTDDLLPAVADRQLADVRRLEVITTVAARPLSAQQQKTFIQTLAAIVGSPQHSPVIRQRTIALLAQRDPRDAGPVLSAALLETCEPLLQEQIIAILAQIRDTRTIGDLVIFLADHPGSGADPAAMPAGRALNSIAGQPLETILAGQLPAAPLKVRLGAVALLRQIEGHSATVARLAALPPDDAVAEQLHFWAARFNYVPTNGPRFLLAQLQRMSLNDKQLDELSERIDLLRRENYAFDIRDTHMLLAAPPAALQVSRNELAERIRRILASREHTHRPASYPAAPDDVDDRFDEQLNRLSYTDLLRIDWLLATLAQPSEAVRQDVLQPEAFVNIFLDPRSEVGGLCYGADGKVQFRKYLPGRRLSDKRYVESAELITDAALCLARWHGHVGADKAGPGVDDVEYARTMDCPVVVITAVSEKVCNVDYLSAEGVVADLGNY